MVVLAAVLSLLAFTTSSLASNQQPYNAYSRSHHDSPPRRYSDVMGVASTDYHPANHPEFVMDEGPRRPVWEMQNDYYGIKTFSRSSVPPVACFKENSTQQFDVAVVGAPFDTTTSYRPGARFGPNGIRQGSQLIGGYNRVMQVDPFETFKIIDCGDIRMSQLNNVVALDQLEDGYTHLINRETVTDGLSSTLALDGKSHPRVLVLGGDHTITLPVLRALKPVYGPITVIHFDSHLDTWQATTDYSHGSYFYTAWQEGLMTDSNVHVGIKNGQWNRTHHNDDGDDMVGFSRVFAEEIDDIGVKGVVKKIRDRVGDNPVYITLDIDVVDPSFAPATGTPATGGYTPREIIRIIQGLAGLRLIGADVVEVAPAYDNVGETTSILAASIGYEFLSIMALTEW